MKSFNVYINAFDRESVIASLPDHTKVRNTRSKPSQIPIESDLNFEALNEWAKKSEFKILVAETIKE